RRSLSGAHSAAAHDALLARARVRAASLARDRARRTKVLGVLRQAAGLVWGGNRAGIARALAVGPKRRPLPLAAVRVGLDPPPRFPRAARGDVPGAMATNETTIITMPVHEPSRSRAYP